MAITMIAIISLDATRRFGSSLLTANNSTAYHADYNPRPSGSSKTHMPRCLYGAMTLMAFMVIVLS